MSTKKNNINTKLLPPTYEEQKFKKVMVERSGFIPRSIQVQKMAVQGELNKIINDYENNKLFGRVENDDRQLGLLNIKGLTRSELIRLARNRYESVKDVFFKDLDPLTREKAILQSKVDLVSSDTVSQNNVENKDN